MKKTIKEIELLLQEEAVTSETIQQLETDERKGVQLLLKKWTKRQETEKEEQDKFLQMSHYENELRGEGISFIAGVDEVGRGPLAGPVVAASVMLKPDFYLAGLNDSKALSESKREQFYEKIMTEAIAVGVGIVDPVEIDKINIYEASKKAMVQAVEAMNIEAEYLLVDAMKIPLLIPQMSIIKGDAKSVSIAASSVIAKVTRDRMMKQLDEQYPEYGFANHMGYGTKQHLEALRTYGVLNAHRRTFAPVRDCLST
jgi:ribonuclease HII